MEPSESHRTNASTLIALWGSGFNSMAIRVSSVVVRGSFRLYKALVVMRVTEKLTATLHGKSSHEIRDRPHESL